jgi:hypothetical protein
MVTKKTDRKGSSKILIEIDGDESEYANYHHALIKASHGLELTADDSKWLGKLLLAFSLTETQMNLDANEDTFKYNHTRAVKMS